MRRSTVVAGLAGIALIIPGTSAAHIDPLDRHHGHEQQKLASGPPSELVTDNFEVVGHSNLIGGSPHGDVWFYDIQADGWSLDDKRQPLLDPGQLGVAPDDAFVVANHDKNNLPDALDRWQQRGASEKSRKRTEQSFCVPTSEIADNDYDLSLNRYREVEYEEIDYPEPSEILANIRALEKEIATGLDDLEKML
jgi:hypothetical protein